MGRALPFARFAGAWPYEGWRDEAWAILQSTLPLPCDLAIVPFCVCTFARCACPCFYHARCYCSHPIPFCAVPPMRSCVLLHLKTSCLCPYS